MIAIRPPLSPSPFTNCCFDSRFIIGIPELKINPAKRRACCDPIENLGPVKKKCVRFSEISFCRELPHEEESDLLQSNPENHANQEREEGISPTPQRSIANNNEQSLDAADQRIIDSNMMTENHIDRLFSALPAPPVIETDTICSSNSSSDRNSAILTKTSDGPSLATLITNMLIQTLLKQGQMNKREVLETLRSASNAQQPPPAEDSKAPASDVGSPQDADGQRRRCLLDRALCDRVHARLQSLTDRLASHGRAGLLPSTSIMGRPLLPALAFLTAAARDVIQTSS